MVLDVEQHNFSALRRELWTARVNVVPFVGAGLARDFGYPLWSEFLLKTADELGLGEGARVLMAGASPKYEECAQLLWNRRRVLFQAAIRDTFCRERNVPSGTTLHQLVDIARGPVLTTNFDRSIERVFELSSKPLELVADNAGARKIAERVRWDVRILVKLHGEAEDDESRVLTKADYTRHYLSRKGETQRPLPALLRYLFQSRIVLFVGCSLRGDRYLQFLRTVFRPGDVNMHYAILERPDDGSLPARSEELDALGIRPIWYPIGEHAQVKRILEMLVEEEKNFRPQAQDKQPRRLTLALDLREHGKVDLLGRLAAESPSSEFTRAWLGPQPRDETFGLVFTRDGEAVHLRAQPPLLAFGGRRLPKVVLEPEQSMREERYGYYPFGLAENPQISLRLVHGSPARVSLRNLETPQFEVDAQVLY